MNIFKKHNFDFNINSNQVFRLLFVACLISSKIIAAEIKIIELKDQSKVKGEIEKEEDSFYLVKTSYGKLKIKKDTIVKIKNELPDPPKWMFRSELRVSYVLPDANQYIKLSSQTAFSLFYRDWYVYPGLQLSYRFTPAISSSTISGGSSDIQYHAGGMLAGLIVPYTVTKNWQLQLMIMSGYEIGIELPQNQQYLASVVSSDLMIDFAITDQVGLLFGGGASWFPDNALKLVFADAKIGASYIF